MTRRGSGEPTTTDVAGIRAVVCDLDGVIRHFEDQAQVEARFGVAAGTVAAAAFAPDLLLPAVTGQISDERWRGGIVASLAPRLGPETAEALVAAWSDSPGRLDPAVLTVLRDVRRAVPVVVLTNATTRLPEDLRRLGIADAFDAVVSSAVTGVAKPHEEAFAAALQAVRTAGGPVPAGQVLFVDDDPRHLGAAERLGWRTHLFRDVAGLTGVLRTAGLPA